MNGNNTTCFLCGVRLGRNKSRTSIRKRERHVKPADELILNVWEERCALSVCQILRIPPGHPAFQVLISIQQNKLQCSTCDQIFRNVDFSLKILNKLQQQILETRQVILHKLQSKWSHLLEQDSALGKKTKTSPSEYSYLKDKDFFVLLDKVLEQQCAWTDGDFITKVAEDVGNTSIALNSIKKLPDFEEMEIKEELMLSDDENLNSLEGDCLFIPDSLSLTDEPPEMPLISTNDSGSKLERVKTLRKTEKPSAVDSDLESTVSNEDPDYTIEEVDGSDEEYEPDDPNLKLETELSEDSLSSDEHLDYEGTFNKKSKKRKPKASTEGKVSKPKTNSRNLGDLSKSQLQKLAAKNNKIECPHGCTRKYHNEASLDRHIHMKHEGIGARVCKCDECGKTLNNPRSLKIHSKVHLAEKQRQTHKSCSFCGIWLPNEEVESHELEHKQREQPFSCLLCDSSETKYLGLAPLNKHMKEVHAEICGEVCDLHRCKQCPKVFFIKKRLNDHLREIHGDLTKHHPCDVCGKVFGARFQVDAHKKTVHIDKSARTRLICELCGKSCVSLEYLNWHRQVHEEGFKFKCKLCDKAFKFNKSLKKHEQIHAGLQFPCPDCPKIFSTLRYLQQHGRVHLPREQRKYYYKTKDDTSKTAD